MKTEIMRIKYFLASMAIVLLLAAGCASAGTVAAPPPGQEPTDPAPLAVASTTAATPASPPVGSQISSFPDFASTIARVKSSVVALTTETTGTGLFGSSFVQEGAGSGWIIDSSGLIVTNNHVVEGARGITVTLEDGRAFAAESVHTDPVADLAIIKINAQDLSALRIGDSSQLRVGEWVVAVGNSLGMGISATRGIVSALGVSLSLSAGETLADLIQTDAAINPGNSGGPLVNSQGEVVGMNSAKVAQAGVEGMGYAISMNEAKPIIDQLIQNGYVPHPFLGAGLFTVSQSVARRYRLAVGNGVLVTSVAAASPADKAGLQPGDVIIAIDDENMSDERVLRQTLNSDQIGQVIKITYWRGTNQNTSYATLVQGPPAG